MEHQCYSIGECLVRRLSGIIGLSLVIIIEIVSSAFVSLLRQLPGMALGNLFLRLVITTK